MTEVAELPRLRHLTVLDLSQSRVLTAFKVGEHWRYRRADLEEWMARKRDVASLAGPDGGDERFAADMDSLTVAVQTPRVARW